MIICMSDVVWFAPKLYNLFIPHITCKNVSVNFAMFVSERQLPTMVNSSKAVLVVL